MPSTYDVACTLGLEDVVAEELRELGVEAPRTRRGGVLFESGAELGYAANLWLRSAVRVTERLVEAPARSEQELYELCRGLPVEQWMSVEQTLAVDASVRDAALTHSGYAAQRVKDALVDRFRDLTGARPSVDTKDPDLPLKLVWRRDRVLLSRDLSGASLHKRGWRPAQVKSPLNEAVAAGLLRLAGWRPGQALADPLCGSGTLLIEAAQRAADMAPGLQRRFAFERWPDTRRTLWDALRAGARERARAGLERAREQATGRASERAGGAGRAGASRGASASPAVLFAGADRHAGAVALARKSAAAAGVGELVDFTVSPIDAWTPPFTPEVVVTNPPWGQRLGEGDDLADTWRALGEFLRRQLDGGHAWVLSGDKELSRHLRLKAERRHPVKTGPVDCRWLGYRLHGRARAG